MPFFTYLSENEAAESAFTGAMAAGSRIQGMLVAEAIDLSDARQVCDVGGGSGSVLAHLLRVHPHLTGSVLDLPGLERDAEAVFAAAGVSDRARFVGGNFFDAVPERCDVYTLFAVIHDWDDERCATILGCIRRAMSADGRILVIEGMMPEHDQEHFLKTADMLMLVLGDGGRERTKREFDVLWRRAGLRARKTTTLASTFAVFELVPA